MKFGHLNEVREWWIPTMRLSAPLILDPTTHSLRRSDSAYARREWADIDEARHQRQVDAAILRLARQHLWDAKRTADRRHLADRFLRRLESHEQLAAFAGRTDQYRLFLANWEGSISQTTLALDSDYTCGTAGDAISGRLQVHASKTLQDVYFFITGFSGTAANVNDINLELRPEASAGAATPHTSTLTEGKTHDPASTTGWNKVTGWTSVLTAAARYFIIVGDADGATTGGGSFATVVAVTTPVWDSTTARPAAFHGVRTTGGFASGNTVSTSPAGLVLVFSDGTVTGNPLTADATPASDTNRRGLRMASSALTASLSIFGITWNNSSANISGMEIWTGSSGPSGTADHVSTDILYSANTATNRFGAMVAAGAAYTLAAGTEYSLVATYSGATQAGPRRHDIGTGEDASLRSAMPGGGAFYFRRANGTSDWSNDLVGSIPDMGVLVDSQVAAAGGSGAIAVGRMSGGMQ